MAKIQHNAKRRRRSRGTCRQLPSGRWQAKILGPDGSYHPAPQTFDTRLDADGWLAGQIRDLEVGNWSPPERGMKSGTLAEYAQEWLASLTVRPRVLTEYRRDLAQRILPDLGGFQLDRITPKMISRWYVSQGDQFPSARAHAYSTLRNLLNTAVDDELIPANPCRIRGAAKAKSRRKIRPATLQEIGVISERLPDRYRTMLLVAVWCGPRFGELTELRRGDVDMAEGLLRISRGVVKVEGQFIVGPPKTEAAIRDVEIPPHIMEVLAAHLDKYVEPGDDALLFPSASNSRRHMSESSLAKVWYPARKAAGRSDLRWHDLRHTGATMAAATGATLADLMSRFGHTTVDAAMIYQHAAQGKGRQIADRMSEMALDES
jgi:integrase